MAHTPSSFSTLQDKVILITGGAQGLGAALSEELARAGARVIIGDVQDEKARALADVLQTKNFSARSVHLDVMDVTQVEHTVEAVYHADGHLDGVINNAGIDITKPIEELSVDEWDRVMAVNLRGPFVVSKFSLPYLIESQGQIVNITSTAAKRTWPNASVYHASKWGLLGFSHALFTEAVKQQVKVTAVVAGGMRTPFILERFPDVDPSTLQDPINVARVVRSVFEQPTESVIPEVMILPMKETSWP